MKVPAWAEAAKAAEPPATDVLIEELHHAARVAILSDRVPSAKAIYILTRDLAIARAILRGIRDDDDMADGAVCEAICELLGDDGDLVH